ncbi:MAG: MarC family protein [Planctomycetota bacterium]
MADADLLSAAVLLFMIMDPLGNTPAFLAALRQVDPTRRRRVVLREMLIAYAVMTGFLFAGPVLLAVFHIDDAALTLAGGLILGLIALKMIFPTPGSSWVSIDGEPLIVPLAIPLVAGPSMLAILTVQGARDDPQVLVWWAAMSLAWLASTLILELAPFTSRLLGDKGLQAVERLVGMLITAIAVQMFLDGLAAWRAG